MLLMPHHRRRRLHHRSNWPVLCASVSLFRQTFVLGMSTKTVWTYTKNAVAFLEITLHLFLPLQFPRLAQSLV